MILSRTTHTAVALSMTAVITFYKIALASAGHVQERYVFKVVSFEKSNIDSANKIPLIISNNANNAKSFSIIDTTDFRGKERITIYYSRFRRKTGSYIYEIKIVYLKKEFNLRYRSMPVLYIPEFNYIDYIQDNCFMQNIKISENNRSTFVLVGKGDISIKPDDTKVSCGKSTF